MGEETAFTTKTAEELWTDAIRKKSVRIQNQADRIATDETMRIAGECLRLEFSQAFEKHLAVWRKRFASTEWTEFLLEDNARRAAGAFAWEDADKAFHLAVTENYPRLWALWYERLLAQEDEDDPRDPRDPRESAKR